MNWIQLALNIGGTFALAYAAALKSGLSPQQAAAVAGLSLAANLSGLFQPAPHKDT